MKATSDHDEDDVIMGAVEAGPYILQEHRQPLEAMKIGNCPGNIDFKYLKPYKRKRRIVN